MSDETRKLAERIAAGLFVNGQGQKAARLVLEPEGRDGWRDMDSAPKDGTRVLISGWTGRGDQRWVTAAMFSAERDYWWSDHESWRMHPPTHWMPLPAPPAATASSPDDREET